MKHEAIADAMQTVTLISKGDRIASHIQKTWNKHSGSDLLEKTSSGLANLIIDLTDSVILEGGSTGPILLVMDEPDDVFKNTVLEKCRTLELPVLPVLGRGPVVTIGPLEYPGVPGCVDCLEFRWNHSLRRTILKQAMKGQIDGALTASLTLSLDDADLADLTNLVVKELDSALQNGGDRLLQHVHIYQRTYGSRCVKLVPSHECHRCQAVAGEGAELVRMEFQPVPCSEDETLRSRVVTYQELNDLYVDKDLGYISAMTDIGSREGYFTASATIQSSTGARYSGYGSSLSPEMAQQTAILEAVERSCGIKASRRDATVYGTYNKLLDTAVHPRSFGLHRDNFYATNPRLVPFHPDGEHSFVWAYSTREDRTVLIPEQIAYYGPTGDKTRFVMETSNGCALGGTLEEAVLYAIFEVLERDGLLNTWYGRMAVPELSLGPHPADGALQLHRFITNKGYQVRLFNIAHDTGIPTVMAVAINEENQTPKVVCASNCHLNPNEAAHGALKELAVQVLHCEGLSDRQVQKGHEMVEDPRGIKEMLHHVVASAIPEAYPKWSFLLDDRDPKDAKPLDEVFFGVSDKFQLQSRDISVILKTVLSHIHGLGFDVLVVNQTNIEAATGGFHVVKALIPGMTPITFGYQSERFRGLKRIFELPERMGYSSRVLTLEDLNPYPHPLA